MTTHASVSTATGLRKHEPATRPKPHPVSADISPVANGGDAQVMLGGEDNAGGSSSDGQGTATGPKENANRMAGKGDTALRSRARTTARVSKTEAALKLLRRKTGASLSELQDETGWQAHSVRGFLSGTVKKKLALELSSEIGKQGVRRYRINDPLKAG